MVYVEIRGWVGLEGNGCLMSQNWGCALSVVGALT